MEYEYVSKKEISLARDEIKKIIHQVQDYLRKEGILTFQYYLVGSASNKRHLVTRLKNGNKGFDLDYNIIIQKIADEYDDAESIKKILMKTFDMFKLEKYTNCKDSTSVFTIKNIDTKTNSIKYSFDFAIVEYYEEEIENPNFDEDYDDPTEEYIIVERQKYIKNDKFRHQYIWNLRPIADDHRYKVQWIKENGLWNNVHNRYLENKNSNTDPNKKSRTMYYETVNEIYNNF
ncbi:MAG: hypothetical protein IKJ33_01430 [Clostridia bacterium]|nr:hypothetical protein [Clostridia bacterium]